MKAIVYTHYGNPEVLTLKEVEKPVPKSNELLIRVYASTANRTDCANLTARPFIMRFWLGLIKPSIQILGTEFAGMVEAAGSEVQGFQAGDRVFGFDDGILSAYAEYLTIAWNKGIGHIPEGVSYQQAAASCEGFHYAFNFVNKVTINPGHKVLVNGASGGIGSAMVQLLHYYQAEITATCATKNIKLIESLGAKRIIDYTTTDFTRDTERFDYIFDAVGKSTYGKSKNLLKPGGVYISSELGPMSQNIFFALYSGIFGQMPGRHRRKVKFPIPTDIKRSVMFVKKLTEEGHFSPVIDRTYSMEQVAKAYEYVLTGQKTGNVVIDMNTGKVNV
ncbi:MAG: NAD(P)-dependent alcohol dehydrogenase [Cyclobacteriaceae bacterium]|nr:NAD(P)-dependent alcohol dehydrogenase [Cyclobacteriaceae bacterium]